MKGCVFVTMSDCLPGFMLAGFAQVSADRENVAEVVAEIINRSKPNLLFIDERLVTEALDERLQYLEKEWGGALVTLPAPAAMFEPGKDDIGSRFIAKVVGYQMKLN